METTQGLNSTHPDTIKAIQQGDEGAYEALFREWYPALVGFSRKFIHDPAESEELVQEMFCQLWDKRNSFNPTTSLKAYLYAAVRNRCFNYLEHRKVRQRSQEAVAERITEQGRQSSPVQIMEEIETKTRIEQAVAELPNRCREVFELSRYEGLKYAEIAQKLEISPKTVEVQIGRALKHLREALRDLLPFLVGILWTLKEIEIYLRHQ